MTGSRRTRAHASSRRLAALVAVVALAAVALTGCGPQQHVVRGSEVTLVTNQAFTSYNPVTSYGNTVANRGIDYATNARFNYYDSEAKLVRDESFGSYSVISEDPLTVKYTMASGVKWSDGTPIDSADLLLAWAANSGTFTTPDFDARAFVDQRTGRYTDDFPEDAVYFDGAPAAGLGRVTQVPEIGDGGRSITLVYDEFFVDWELAFQVGVPAHVVGAIALGTDDPESAKSAVTEAIQSGDTSALAPISRAWNSAFNFEEFPDDASLVVGSGPYAITAIEPQESVTLTANPEYRGRNQPSIETVTVRTISDPLASVAALADGTADIIAPASTGDVLTALEAIDGITVTTGFGGTWEHLDLQFENSRNGTFGDARIREAFLKMVPRQQILDELVTPLYAEAQLLDSHVFMPGVPGYDEAVEANGSADYARVDVAGARSLLEDAGVGTDTVPVCILFDPANPRRVAEFQLIQKSAQRVGFEVTSCSQSSWADFLGVKGAYDAALFGWNTTNLAVSSPEARLRSDSSISNLNGFADPAVDDLLDRIGATSDAGEHRALLAEVDALLWQQAYGVPLYQFPQVTAHSNRVDGVVNSPLDPGIVWNIWNWQPSADSESSSPSR